MKLFIKLLIVFFTFFFTSQVFANDTVNYISMNKILNESMAGLSIKNKLEKIHKSNIEKFKTKDQDFKTKEQSLLSKRNLMKKDEFELKINDLRENYKKYQEEKKKNYKRYPINEIKVQSKF